MKICMTGLDDVQAPIELREQLSFTKSAAAELDRRMVELGCRGAVVLSTCNRTEVYLSLDEGQDLDPRVLLCQAAGISSGAFDHAFIIRWGVDCARHLMEVACGLRSQILGEDQILTQVKAAVALAREAGSADGVLETLFRTAAACGKSAKAGGRLSGVPTSAAHRAVEVLRERLGTLEGRSALVIGNGEMGRLAAELLREAGCRVCVTLRTYRHGETVVPAGCSVVPYEARYAAMEGTDMVLSATTSPHYTVTLEPFCGVSRPPRILVDLAIPRDIQPELAERAAELTLLNIDDLHQNIPTDQAALDRVHAAVEVYLNRFYQWNTYRESLPALETLKDALRQRVRAYLEAGMDSEEAADLAVDKAVELITGGLPETISADALEACAARIRQHTRS